MADTANDLNDFTERFWALQEEAKSYGIQSVVVLHDNDPIDETSECMTQYCASKTLALGMVQEASHALLFRESETI